MVTTAGTQEIFEKIRTIVADQLHINKDTITPESTIEQLGADSLDRVEIIMKLEEAFGIEINDEEADKIATIGQAVDYITRLKK